MQNLLTSTRTAQVLLTVGVLEFFGPVVRDIDATHLLNPLWVGHARFHLMWLLVFMAASGIMNLVLIWWWSDRRSLWTAWAWQACCVAGFWGAAALSGVYGGHVVDRSIHSSFGGLNENLIVFIVLAGLSAITLAVLGAGQRQGVQRAAA